MEYGVVSHGGLLVVAPLSGRLPLSPPQLPPSIKVSSELLAALSCRWIDMGFLVWCEFVESDL
jgi:hypothetical protein